MYDRNVTRGSYFVWEWDNRRLPAYQPSFKHKSNFSKRFRLRSDRKVVWGGNLSGLVLEKLPDLVLVRQIRALVMNFHAYPKS